MFAGARVAVVVPAFEEARMIVRTLRSLPSFVDHVIVVDDGSRDGTFERARSTGDPRVEVLRHAENRGVGAAIVSGYQRAFAAGADVAAVMAGDAQMDPEDLPPLLRPVVSGELAYAKGDRLSHARARAQMPRLRWLGNHTLSWLTRAATGVKVRDSQCGYTALSRGAYDRLPLEQLWPRYGYPNDLIGQLAAFALPIGDVVVRPVYGEETSGIGWRHALAVIPWVLARVSVRRILSAVTTRLEPAPPRLPAGR